MQLEQPSIAMVELGGLVQICTDRPVGSQVRVIVLGAEEPLSDTTLALARLQEQSGFAREVLANPAEDVWNDL